VSAVWRLDFQCLCCACGFCDLSTMCSVQQIVLSFSKEAVRTTAQRCNVSAVLRVAC
jgi:hypothetical protein